MDIITHYQLRDLIEAGTPPCVSIFMPTHREREMRQDPARLKNLLRDAEDKLISKGMRPTLARDMLEPAKRLVDDAGFWSSNEHGLAIYICEGFFRQYRLPIEVEESAMVNDRFDIKPLLPLMLDKLFYVLALSQKDVRLLECTPHSCRRLELPKDVALSIEDAVIPGGEHQTQTVKHPTGANTPAGMAGSFHGQATDIQQKELEDRLFFYRQLDDGVRRVVRDPGAPLVIAGADSTAPFYRQASQVKDICEEWVHGNPEHVNDETLHDKALTLLEPQWQRNLHELQEQYGTAHAHQLASNNIYQIVPAAAQGRVGILFVAPEIRKPGKFDPEALIVDDESDEEDLIDAAATQTLMTGGQIVIVKPEQIPGDGEVAAIYRYMA